MLCPQTNPTATTTPTPAPRHPVAPHRRTIRNTIPAAYLAPLDGVVLISGDVSLLTAPVTLDGDLTIGAQDGTTGVLTVSPNGDWWYSAAWNTGLSRIGDNDTLGVAHSDRHHDTPHTALAQDALDTRVRLLLRAANINPATSLISINSGTGDVTICVEDTNPNAAWGAQLTGKLNAHFSNDGQLTWLSGHAAAAKRPRSIRSQHQQSR
jgi:hypothetical protein